jgi:dihydroorotase
LQNENLLKTKSRGKISKVKNSFLITGGHVVSPADKIDRVTDVFIRDGKISKIAANLNRKNCQKISAVGKFIFPGLIDAHAHLREPGREDKEDLKTGLKSAVAGGFTAVATMPNTTPEVADKSQIELQLSKARNLNLAKVLPIAKITVDGKISEIGILKAAGAIGFSDDGTDTADAGILRRAMQWAKTFEMPLLIHTENSAISGAGQINDGPISFRMGLAGIPKSAEITAVDRILNLAIETGARVHFCHISTAESLEKIRAAKKLISEKFKKESAPQISAETCPHYFSFSENRVEKVGPLGKINPPLRSEFDLKAVRAALADGTLDIISTDHAPHTAWEKAQPFNLAPFGTVGFETALAAAYTFLVKTKILKISDLIAKFTINPAKILRQNLGNLKPGTPADLIIFNPSKSWTVAPENFFSKGKN